MRKIAKTIIISVMICFTFLPLLGCSNDQAPPVNPGTGTGTEDPEVISEPTCGECTTGSGGTGLYENRRDKANNICTSCSS